MNFFSQKNRILLKELIKTDFKLRYQGSFIGYFETFDDVYNYVPCLCSFLEI